MRSRAIIVDLDGTLTNNTHRVAAIQVAYADRKITEEEWDDINTESMKDEVQPWCANLVTLYSEAGYQILFVTGRNEKYRNDTKAWLANNLPSHVSYELYMRPLADNQTEDFLVKEKLYDRYIVLNYDVEIVVDDRASVVDKWREMGLVTLQCAKGDY